MAVDLRASSPLRAPLLVSKSSRPTVDRTVETQVETQGEASHNVYTVKRQSSGSAVKLRHAHALVEFLLAS